LPGEVAIERRALGQVVVTHGMMYFGRMEMVRVLVGAKPVVSVQGLRDDPLILVVATGDLRPSLTTGARTRRGELFSPERRSCRRRSW
jgi:hypothetical protein